MAQLNFSYKLGGLTCSFNDYQLAEFIQQRRRSAGKLPVKSCGACRAAKGWDLGIGTISFLRSAGKLPVKTAVEHVGPQEDGTWVLGPSLFFDKYGSLLDPEDSKYAWIGHLYEGNGIAHRSSACLVNMPPSIDPLRQLYAWAKLNLQHNFIPCMLLSGSCCMALHYETIVDTFLFCPIPIAYGRASGTGKTTALSIGLSPTGSYPSRLVSKATYEKFADLCSSSYLPLGVDDPKSKGVISDLVIALFNGLKGATMKYGERLPTSMAVISSNFTTVEQEK